MRHIGKTLNPLFSCDFFLPYRYFLHQACILPSVKHIASLVVCPVYELNLSPGYTLVIHEYMVNFSCDKALAFNWFTNYLPQQFTIENTLNMWLCSVITWLQIFKEEEHSHREWSSTWPRNHWLRENTAKNFCIWLTFESYRVFLNYVKMLNLWVYSQKKKKITFCDLSCSCSAAEKVNNLSEFATYK